MPSGWVGSTEAVAEYAWCAAADPAASLGQIALASICEALEGTCQARYGVSAREAGTELDHILRKLVDEDTPFWRPVLERIALLAYEGVLYGDGVDRESAWQALEHPWGSDRGATRT